MPITLYHNAMSRAAMIHALLEELGVPYTLSHVDYEDGSMRTPEFLALNPMGKIPTLTDGDGGEHVVTEYVAIAIYLADKYKSPNDLAPAVDHPDRAEYLRWMVYASSCLEPAMTQKSTGVQLERRLAGWGDADLVIETLKNRVARADPWMLGDRFSAVDVVLGMSLGWAVNFDIFPSLPEFEQYLARLFARPALQTATAQSD